MKVKFYNPRNKILKKYIDGYYFMSEDAIIPSNRYWSFPNNFCIATVCQNAIVIPENNKISIIPFKNKLSSDLYYNNSFPVELFYESPRNEITVYFKPLGILNFVSEIHFDINKDTITGFAPYSDYLDEMDYILKIKDREKQIQMLENYWLSKFNAKDLSPVEEILNNIEKGMKINDIAEDLNISRQYLHKLFFKNIGKSPSEYQKTHRFKSIIDNYKTNDKFIELSYSNKFFDQPHFNKNFKKLTGVKPSLFFSNVDITENNFWLFV